MLPEKFHKYFWDVEVKKINIIKSSFYVCERLLEYGDFNALKWVFQTFGKEFVTNVIKKSKAMSLKSQNFYSLYFGIHPKKILCLQEGFRKEHRAIWSR